MTKQLNASTII